MDLLIFLAGCAACYGAYRWIISREHIRSEDAALAAINGRTLDPAEQAAWNRIVADYEQGAK